MSLYTQWHTAWQEIVAHSLSLEFSLLKLGVVAVAVDGIGIAKVRQVSGDATSLVLTVFVVSAIVCSYGNPMYRFPFSCKPQPQISPA